MISSRQRKYALVTGASSGIGREYAAQLAANYEKFLWEVGMAQKFPWWKEDASLQKIQNAYDEMMRYFGYSMKIKNIMKTEYGLPGVTAPNPYAAISMENILGFILGMRGTAMMMRRARRQGRVDDHQW